MRNKVGFAGAERQYAAAYAVHYKMKDLHEALDLYKGVIDLHPDSQEAEYSRTQIENIVNDVVPEQELLDAHVALALTHLERIEAPEIETTTVTSLASDLPGQHKAEHSPEEEIR